MNKIDAKVIRQEMEAALNAVLAKHNLKATRSVITYGDTNFSYRIQGIELNESGSKKVTEDSIKIAEWMFLKHSYKVSTETVKTLFTTEYKHPKIGTFKLVDVDTKKRKFPFIVENEKHQSYKLSAAQLANITGIDASFIV